MGDVLAQVYVLAVDLDDSVQVDAALDILMSIKKGEKPENSVTQFNSSNLRLSVNLLSAYAQKCFPEQTLQAHKHLATRTYNALRLAHDKEKFLVIQSIADLTAEKFCELPNLGQKALTLFEEILKRHRMTLHK